ncbi:MAG: hypothetical protein U0441_32950 [Polyangiaceae bacterium]
MAFILRIPANVNELEESLKKIWENKSHVSSITMNESTSQLWVDLDWAANKFGGEAGKDFAVPIRRGKLRDAKVLIDKLMIGGHGPSRSEAQELFDLIDPQNK